MTFTSEEEPSKSKGHQPEGRDEAAPWVSDFVTCYSNLGVQLADACLVYLAEREGIQTVFTLDRRDFTVYRFGKNKSFNLIPEPA